MYQNAPIGGDATGRNKSGLPSDPGEGAVRPGRITSIRDFGIFVDVGGADGLVHLSELSWERTPKSPQEMFNVGDEAEVYVLKVDQESKKIALSLRRAARYRRGGHVRRGAGG